MPMMPFIGVRISWLTVARKRDFAWLANSARSRALISAVSARLRAVMSRAIARCETASLALSRTDSSIHENQRGALRRADRDVGRAQAFAVGEGGVRNDADIDAELGKRAAGQVAAGRRRSVRRRPGWRRRCGRRGRDARRGRRARRSGRGSVPRSPAAPTCGRTSVSNSARLRTVVASTSAASRPSARKREGEQKPARARPMHEQRDGNEARRAEQMGEAGGHQDRDDQEEMQFARVGALERRRQRRRRDMRTRRRMRVDRRRRRRRRLRVFSIWPDSAVMPNALARND